VGSWSLLGGRRARGFPLREVDDGFPLLGQRMVLEREVLRRLYAGPPPSGVVLEAAQDRGWDWAGTVRAAAECRQGREPGHDATEAVRRFLLGVPPCFCDPNPFECGMDCPCRGCHGGAR
jgi:hypothetical protein